MSIEIPGKKKYREVKRRKLKQPGLISWDLHLSITNGMVRHALGGAIIFNFLCYTLLLSPWISWLACPPDLELLPACTPEVRGRQ